MDAVIATEVRIQRLQNRTLWIPNAFPPEFWLPYRNVFRRIVLMARVEDIECVSDGWLNVQELNLEVISLPIFIGPVQFAFAFPRVVGAIRNACLIDAAFILRAPGIIAQIASLFLKTGGRDFAVELLGDPKESIGSLGNEVATKIARHALVASLKWTCKQALAVNYINHSVLPRLYPAPTGAILDFCSDVILKDDAIASMPRQNSSTVQVIVVASLERPYKGIDVLLKAKRICLDQGIHFKLLIVGEGRLGDVYRRLAETLNISDEVQFLGHIPTTEVYRKLDSSSLFVLPSLTEGLPRALLEAMARGLPAIATSVGGIPELLPEDSMCAPGDVDALARLLRKFLLDPNLMKRHGSRNLEKAKEYSYDALCARRTIFYEAFKKALLLRRKS